MQATVRKNRVKFLRERSRLTQEELATLTNQALSTVCKHETHDRGLSDKAISAYARVFKIPTYQLFVGPEELESDVEMDGCEPFPSGASSYLTAGVAL